MRSMILGVSGMDGANLARYLVGQGDEVIGIARRTSLDHTLRLKDLIDNPNFIFREGDVCDLFSLSQLFREFQPDEIYNLAAMSHVKTSFDQPMVAWTTIAEGCLNILNAVLTTCPSARTYNAASSEMFGDQYDELVLPYAGPLSAGQYRLPCGNLTFEREFRYQDEQTRMNPQSPYAIAKLAAYNTVRLYRKSYGLHACNGILFNHECSTRPIGFVTKKIADYVANLHDSHFSPQFPKLKLGNLDAHRDWGLSSEYVQGMVSILRHHTPDDFVIATGETHTVREFAETAFQLVGKNYLDYVEIDENLKRPSEVPFLRGYPHKAKKILGWSPTTTFNDLVSILVEAEFQCISA